MRKLLSNWFMDKSHGVTFASSSPMRTDNAVHHPLKGHPVNLKRMLAGCGAAVALVLAPLSAPTFADAPSAPTGVPAAVPLSDSTKVANWQKLQYGMFMHFGVYSVYGGYYNGHRQGMGYPEQIKAWENIPTDDYLAKAKDLASNFDAAAICKTVHDSGMTYLMITSKHHDGFAMWDTKTTDYNIVKQSNYGKDPMKELSTECNKLGVKLAFYFSIIDWTKQTPEPYGNVNPIDEELMTGTIKPQLTELLTNYGPIAELWFDMGGPTAEQSQRMAQWVHELQPDTMVNSRVWNKAGDFEVGGDNSVTTDFHMGPWESIRSIYPACWGYCSWANRDESAKSYKERELVNNLIGTVASGGQFAYNIGPKGDGTIDAFDSGVVTEVGQWMARHPDAITGARPTWFPAPSWGKIMTKGNDLYFFPEQWSPGQTLTLPSVGGHVTAVTVDGTDRSLGFTQDGTTLTVTMSGENPEPNLRPVIKVTFDAAPTYVPTQTVTAIDGATISSEQFFGRASALRYSGAQAYDAYLVNKGDKAITDLTLAVLGQLRRLHDLQDHPRDHVHRGDRRADRGRRSRRGLHPRARNGDAPAPRAGSPLLLRQPDRPALRERDRARLRRERGHPASRHRHGPLLRLRQGGGERHLHRRRLGPPGRHHPVVPRPQGRDRRNGDPGCHESHVHADDDARR